MDTTRSPTLMMWNSEISTAFAPFGGTTADNVLEYFLGTPEIETNVSCLILLYAEIRSQK